MLVCHSILPAIVIVASSTNVRSSQLFCCGFRSPGLGLLTLFTTRVFSGTSAWNENLSCPCGSFTSGCIKVRLLNVSLEKITAGNGTNYAQKGIIVWTASAAIETRPGFVTKANNPGVRYRELIACAKAFKLCATEPSADSNRKFEDLQISLNILPYVTLDLYIYVHSM